MKPQTLIAFAAALLLLFITWNSFAQQMDTLNQAQFLALVKKAAITLSNEKADAKKLKKAAANMKATQEIYYKRVDSLREADDTPQPVYDANSVDLGAVVMKDLIAKEDTSKEHKNYLDALLTHNTLTIIHIFGKEAGPETWLLLAKKMTYEGKDYEQYLQSFTYSDKSRDAYTKVIKNSLLDLATKEAKKRSDY